MQRNEFTIGLPVRLTRHIEIYPIGIFHPGLRGTVTSVDAVAPFHGVVAMVKLDEHFEGLDDWNNELQVWETPDAGDCTVDAFARADIPAGPGDIEFEFADYDQSTLPVIPAGFRPTHWHNDICPSWQLGHLRLWIDYADDSMREFPCSYRYTLQFLSDPDDASESTTLIHTSDWTAVMAVIINHPDFALKA